MEAIVKARPDLLLTTRDDGAAEDQGRAFLAHPGLTALYPPGRRMVLPERLTVCGGPMLVEALDRLGAEVARVAP
jgi:iron complex transport system substrate-binding protein